MTLKLCVEIGCRAVVLDLRRLWLVLFCRDGGIDI